MPTRYARLEDDLSQTVAHANLVPNQQILLKVERRLLVVHSNDLRNSVEHSISPTVRALHSKIICIGLMLKLVWMIISSSKRSESDDSLGVRKYVLPK